MRKLLALTFALVAAVLVTLAPAGPARAADDHAASYKDVFKDQMDAVVMVRFVAQVTRNGGSPERTPAIEVNGLMISGKGTVLISNSSIGGRLPQGVTVSPVDIKVLVGEDSEGVDAKVLARDSDLDLCWIQIKKPADKPYAFVDFSANAAAAPDLGAKLITMRRLPKYYDRALVFAEGAMGGMVKKPREMFVTSRPLVAMYGLPIFTAEGKVLGFTANIQPEETEGIAETMRGVSQGDMLLMVLPAGEVAKATQRALEAGGEESTTTTRPSTRPGE